MFLWAQVLRPNSQTAMNPDENPMTQIPVTPIRISVNERVSGQWGDNSI